MAATKKSDVKDAKVSATKTTKKTTASAKKTTTKKAPVKKTTSKKASTTTKKAAPKKTTTIVQEENSYGKTLLAGLLIIVLLVGGFFTYKKYNKPENKKANVVLTEDEKKFKKEYESLNGTTRSNGKTVKDIEILEDNNIVYISVEEAAKILDEGSGIIYFGFATCPWSRNAIPELLTAASNTNLDKIYYVDVRPNDDEEKDIRDQYILNTRNKATIKKKASDAYYNILLSLANELSDYVLTTDSGKKVNTGEKRLYAPTVVAVANGEIIGFHEGTVENHEKDENGELRDLTDKEKENLRDNYSQMISKYLNDECSKDSEGC